MSSRTHNSAVAAVVVVALLVLVPGVFFGLSSATGKAFVGSSRVLAGDVPYRDFWTMYAPGHFYLSAALMSVFGQHLIVPALAACMLRALSAAMLFALGKRFGASAKTAFAIAFVFSAASFELTPELTSYVVALPLLLAALWFELDAVESERASRWLLTGVALGIAAWFKHDVAAYAAVACAAAPFALWWRTPSSDAPLRRVARVAFGAIVGAAPAIALIAWFAGADAWRDLIVFPAGDFRAVRSEAYAAPLPRIDVILPWMSDVTSLVKARDAIGALSNWLLCYVPEVAFVAGAVWLASARRKLDNVQLAGAAILLAMLPLFWAAAHVQQNTHLISMAIASLLLCALAWRTLEPSQRIARGAFVLIACSHCVGLLLNPAQDVYTFTTLVRRSVSLGLPSSAFVRVSPKQRDVDGSIVDFVRANTRDDEPIHVGLARHDAVVIGSPRFYFLCDRPPATRYPELHPGITDRTDVQREMIAELEAKHVRCAILWRFGWPDDVLDGILRRRMERVPDTGAKLLDEYFATQFEPVFERGEYVVVWRRGEARPRTR